MNFFQDEEQLAEEMKDLINDDVEEEESEDENDDGKRKHESDEEDDDQLEDDDYDLIEENLGIKVSRKVTYFLCFLFSYTRLVTKGSFTS